MGLKRADLKRKREKIEKDLRDVCEDLEVTDKALHKELEEKIDALIKQLPANDEVRYYKKVGRDEISRLNISGEPFLFDDGW